MRSALVCALLLFTHFAGAEETAPVLVLDHANVYQGASKPPLRDATIIIRGHAIESVLSSRETVPVAANAKHIDLHGAWVLPGLIDAHLHVYDKDAVHRMLALGITTGRSMLTDNYDDVALKTEYQRGAADVPRILAAGFPVVAHPTTFKPDLAALFKIYPDLDDLKTRDHIGADGARRIVIDNAKRSVDWIKVFANGRAGVLSAEPSARDLDDAELAAAVAEATKLGLPAAAHAFSDDGASAAVRAGVRTIEHGSLITDKTLILMRDHHACLTPTLSVIYTHMTAAPDASEQEKAIASRMQTMLKGAHVAIATARKLGVSVIAGTDSIYDEHWPTVVDEIQYLADEGFSSAEAIDAATSQSAACLGLDKRIGAIRAGLDADIVAYPTDPTADLHALGKPVLVVNHGNVYLNQLAVNK